MSDFEIDEIRRLRHRVSADCGHDLQKVAEYYRNVEKDLRRSGRYRFADEEKQKGAPADATKAD